jgi:hypothetical protein
MSFRSFVKKKIRLVGAVLLEQPPPGPKDNLLLGRLASWQVRQMPAISSLQDVEFKVSSQWGQDGIIDWLIERANIPSASRSFIEFGVENYRESNTRFLLQNRNWRGLIMDGNPQLDRFVKDDALFLKYDLTVKSAFITRENINDLIAGSGFSGEIGLLSVDIDGNDYWVWEAIEVVQPILCICEYNAVFGDLNPVSTPYDPEFYQTKAHFSNLYFGASVAALRSLAARKGYRFLGTNSAGNDAFFVREDYAERFVDHAIRDIVAFPSKARGSCDAEGNLNYVGRLQRLQVISDLPVVNTVTGQTLKIAELPAVYSPEWIAEMTGSTQPST